MTSNEKYIDAEKAINTTDQLANGGKLPAELALQLIDTIFDETGVKGNGRTVQVTAETYELHKIGVGRRVAMLASEAVDPGKRRTVTTSKVTLQPIEIIVPFEISYNFLEVNIEGESAEQHIVRMMATQCGNNVENQWMDSDTLGPAALESDLDDEKSGSTLYQKDTFLAAYAGLLRQADSGHGVDLEGANVGSTAFSRMLNAMPSKYKRRRPDMRFFCSIDEEQNYRDRVSSRQTPKGDATLSTSAPETPFGVPLIALPLFAHQPRVVEHVTLTGTTPVALRYTPFENVVVTRNTLGKAGMAAYVETTDYVLTATTIERSGGSTIGSGEVVKVTYDANPQMLLTPKSNMIFAIGRDVTIEYDKDIYKRVRQYAITLKVAVSFEEVDAVVKGYNFAVG